MFMRKKKKKKKEIQANTTHHPGAIPSIKISTSNPFFLAYTKISYMKSKQFVADYCIN